VTKKVHAGGFRLGLVQKWKSQWFHSNKNIFSKFAHLDFEIQKYIRGVFFNLKPIFFVTNIIVIKNSFDCIYIFIFYYKLALFSKRKGKKVIKRKKIGRKKRSRFYILNLIMRSKKRNKRSAFFKKLKLRKYKFFWAKRFFLFNLRKKAFHRLFKKISFSRAAFCTFKKFQKVLKAKLFFRKLFRKDYKRKRRKQGIVRRKRYRARKDWFYSTLPMLNLKKYVSFSNVQKQAYLNRLANNNQIKTLHNYLLKEDSVITKKYDPLFSFNLKVPYISKGPGEKISVVAKFLLKKRLLRTRSLKINRNIKHIKKKFKRRKHVRNFNLKQMKTSLRMLTNVNTFIVTINLLKYVKFFNYKYKRVRNITGSLRTFIRYFNQKYRRFVNMIPDLVKICYITLCLKQPEILARFLAYQLRKTSRKRRQTKFIVVTQKILLSLSRASSDILGFKIKIKGRINGKRRARSLIIRVGKFPQQSPLANIAYSVQHGIFFYGTLGIKVWLYHNPLFWEIPQQFDILKYLAYIKWKKENFSYAFFNYSLLKQKCDNSLNKEFITFCKSFGRKTPFRSISYQKYEKLSKYKETIRFYTYNVRSFTRKIKGKIISPKVFKKLKLKKKRFKNTKYKLRKYFKSIKETLLKKHRFNRKFRYYKNYFRRKKYKYKYNYKNNKNKYNKQNNNKQKKWPVKAVNKQKLKFTKVESVR